jgi:hypothetical protein
MRFAGFILGVLGGHFAYRAFVDLLPENRFSDGTAGVWLAIWAVIFISFGVLLALKKRFDRLDRRRG